MDIEMSLELDKIQTIDEYFPYKYYINLDKREDRKKECEAELMKHSIIAERISAVDGSLSFQPGLNRNAGAHGLKLTIIKILKDAIENEFSKILIFEDDVMFVENANQIFGERVKHLPANWEFLFLGGTNNFERGEFGCISKHVDFKITRETYKNLDHELCTTTWTQTTHAVGIRDTMLYPLLNALESGKGPIDMIYCDFQQKNSKTYTFMPSIALQRPSFSDIENTFVDYNTNKRWSF